MRSSRLASLVLIVGAVAGGLVLDATGPQARLAHPSSAIVAGVAIPAVPPVGQLTSTWYCAGGTANDGGVADHVILLTNPTDQLRHVTVTALPGAIAPDTSPATSSTSSSSTSTTSTTSSTTSTTVAAPAPRVVELPAQGRVEVPLSALVGAPLAGAVVEVDGGGVAVEHQITGAAGRATAPCASTAARDWSFPWGVTLRGTRELLVFMNPFPNDATASIDFATDEGTRSTLRFKNFVVPGRSVVGAYIDQDVTRKSQVSAQVHVATGRLVVDRIQIFDGTDPTYEGITLGLGAPTPAPVWIFPDGKVGKGITEQVVVYNPTAEVAQVNVDVRLDDAAKNGVPEPFELTLAPQRFAVVDLAEPDVTATPDTPKRVPDGVAHSIIVRSLNGVPVTAERVVTSSAPNTNLGVGATLGSPVAAPTWLFSGGGVSAQREEYITVVNDSNDRRVRVSIAALSGGQKIAVQGLQNLVVPPGGRRSIRLSDHIQREVLPVIVTADGPIVAERGLYRVGGRGLSQSMGIPLAAGVVVPDALNG